MCEYVGASPDPLRFPILAKKLGLSRWLWLVGVTRNTATEQTLCDFLSISASTAGGQVSSRRSDEHVGRRNTWVGDVSPKDGMTSLIKVTRPARARREELKKRCTRPLTNGRTIKTQWCSISRCGTYHGIRIRWDGCEMTEEGDHAVHVRSLVS